MARKVRLSSKQLQIDHDNSVMLIAVAIAAFLIVFSLVASKALLTQRSYQSKVISKKKVALRQAKTNVDEVNKLKVSYQAFAEQSENIIGGSSTGKGDRDGENSRIILDALPSKYDFPALATSINKIINNNNFVLKDISGSDDEVAQAAQPSTGTPLPVEMPFAIGVESPTDRVKQLMQVFESSIRPMQVQTLNITGIGGDNLSLDLSLKTYYQPTKSFQVGKEVVR